MAPSLELPCCHAWHPLSAQPRAAPDDAVCTPAPVLGATSLLPCTNGLRPDGPGLLPTAQSPALATAPSINCPQQPTTNIFSPVGQRLPAASASSMLAGPSAPPTAPQRPEDRFFRQVYTRRAPATRLPPLVPLLVHRPCPRAWCLSPVVNQHPMTTRAKQGFWQPALYHAAPLSPIPKTFRRALADPNWRAAMEEEHSALLQNSTWDLISHPPRTNVVSGKWISKHKFKVDGSLEWYKAR